MGDEQPIHVNLQENEEDKKNDENNNESNSNSNANIRPLGPPPIKRLASSQDIRSTALEFHTKMSKELWGKNQANNSCIHLLPSTEIEAFALDTAIRAFWSLQRENDDVYECFLSAEMTQKIRDLSLDTLIQYQSQLTAEYSFEFDDPNEIKKRQEEKSKNEKDSAEAKRLRLEANKREREERKRRMQEKHSASQTNLTALSSCSDSTSASKPRLNNRSLSFVPTMSPDTSTTNINNTTTTTTTTTATNNTPSITISPSTTTTTTLNNTDEDDNNTTTTSTTNTTPSSSEPDATAVTVAVAAPEKKIVVPSLKKGFTSIPVIKAPPTRELVNSSLRSNNRLHSIPQISRPPPRETATSSSITTTEGEEGKRELPIMANKPAIDRMAAFQRKSSTSKQFVVPRSVQKRDTIITAEPVTTEELPIPKIRITQSLVDADELTKHIFARIASEFTQINSICTKNPNKVEYYHYSVKGPKPANEDEYTVVEHINDLLCLPKTNDTYSFLAVYDGHSGKYTSLYARSQIHYKACTNQLFFENPEKAIVDSVLLVDKLVSEIQDRGQFACGTTALSVWIKNNEELIVANVGDCRGFLLRDGQPVEIAVPHHPDSPDEKARILNNGGAVVWHGAWRVNGVLAVSRSIGDVNMKKWVIPDPDISRFKLSEADEFLILASDGLWDVIQPGEIADLVHQICAEKGRRHVCKELCVTALERNSKDNITVIVVFF